MNSHPAAAQKKKSQIKTSRFPSFILSALLLAAPALHAATDTWIGATGADWSTSGNWTTAKPGAADTALFNTTLATVANAVADQSVGSISFDTAAGTGSGNFTIGTAGSYKLILSNAGAVQILPTLAGTGKTIAVNSDITLTPASTTTAGTYTFSNNATDAANTLNFGGAISAGTTSSNETLTLTGTNTGNNTIGGIIGNGLATGGLALTKSGAGTWVLSGNNTYTGTTTVSAGTLTLTGNNTSALISVGNTGNTGTQTLNIQGGSDTFSNAISVGFSNGNATVNQSAGAITAGSIFMANGSGGSSTANYNLSGGSLNVTNATNGIIMGTNGGGAGSPHSSTFTVSGTGNLTTSNLRIGRNNLTGITSVRL